jgi:hypothetical protein
MTIVAKRAPARCVPAHTCSATAIRLLEPDMAMDGDDVSSPPYEVGGKGCERIDVSSFVSGMLFELRQED